MKFHLNFTPKPPEFHVTHQQNLLLIGSCFSDYIGHNLSQHKFKCLVNPSGILFNPLSIAKLLQQAIDGNTPNEQNFFVEQNQRFHSYLHHSQIHANTREELLTRIEHQNKICRDYLAKTDLLFITFGSAYHYFHRQLNTTVANCHKQPAQLFDKQLLSVQQIVDLYVSLCQHIQQVNPQINFVFTVSPVKHLKDGLVENNISKATLLLSVKELCEKIPRAHYFPAFELVNDDLRDHRFYKADLAHPNDQAINYVWEKFKVCFFDEHTQKITAEIEKLLNYSKHRPLFTQQNQASQDDAYTANQKALIQKLCPEIEF
jgi:hypothetical protein